MQNLPAHKTPFDTLPHASVSDRGKPLLAVRALCKTFVCGTPDSLRRIPALTDVELNLSSGEIVALAGLPGSGKTTLLQCVAGLLRRDRGSVEWFGESFPGGGCLPGLAFVPASPAYYPFLTVRDVLEYRGARDRPPRDSWGRSIQTLARELRLVSCFHRRVSALSDSELARLALAEALTCEPAIIFVDTRTGAPLGDSAREALELRADAGAGIIVAVRDAGLLGSIASRTVIMHEGRVVGTAGEAINDKVTMPFGEPARGKGRLVAERHVL